MLHPKKPNKKEEALINEVFGDSNLPGISKILSDVIQLYPQETFFRTTDRAILKVIGASKSEESRFYVIDQSGSIYLLHTMFMLSLSKGWIEKAKELFKNKPTEELCMTERRLSITTTSEEIKEDPKDFIGKETVKVKRDRRSMQKNMHLQQSNSEKITHSVK